MKLDFIKDKNNKLSHKRIIACLCFAIAVILTILKVWLGMGDNYLIVIYLGGAGIEGYACTKETKL